MPTPLTFLGHASFRLDSPGGKRIYIDPWLTGNPKCPEAEQAPERVDLIALTHGHGDHLGDTIRLWNEFKPPVIALVELRGWLEGQGVESSFPQNPNKGGTVDIDGVKLTFTDANHSSSVEDGTYTGEPAGLVLELPRHDDPRLPQSPDAGGAAVRVGLDQLPARHRDGSQLVH